MAASPADRTALYDEVLRRFASGVRAAQLYASDHPLLARNVNGLVAALDALHQSTPSVAVGIVGGEFVVSDTPMSRTSAGMTELIRRLRDHQIERIAFERGVTAAEAAAFIHAVAALGSKADGRERPLQSAHIRAGRITAEDKRSGGIASDMAAIRQLYSNAVQQAETVWDSAESEGSPDMPAALQTVEGLADAVTQNRTALMALTAMRNYDNYTFTHMVNVSILTMGQARALGVDGRLLREFGLSALMHDIGKVRTPKEILNKPDKLTDDEFTIMRKHTVDGAEILRRTPEMPVLAPVVAFEHHLRMDGSGYPFGVKRERLNVATMLCSIADVYDAMRSQRAYQQAFPTDRILGVLKRSDGTQFDQHLVRRFVQLLGIYPPGNLVKLDTGEIAVVLKVHAPDPYRPRVRVVIDAHGAKLNVPFERNLFDAPAGAGPAVVRPIDPAEVGIDPLTFLN
ncbi:MAG TPA: HD-GYP domain-containing protein [Vicinamibacterales bacterium]|jgi:putative nucleotidyltransferase with HDIG domain|nr:HD-GYP domain-containing protein [Vicinamibacterales bacterium]